MNNILKIEWEFSYSLDKNTYSDRIALGFGVDYDTYTSTAHGFNTRTTYNDEISETYNNHATLLYPALYANQNIWQKIIIYVDYNNYNIYFEFPSKNYAVKSNRQMQRDNPLDYNLLRFFLSSTDQYYPIRFLKVDNILISAVNTLPKLNIVTIDSAKFNLYPNPATNIVNITNNENLVINQIEIYDFSGKLINIQNFNNETEIQLNVENLQSNTYILHLQTNEGLAIKK